MKPFALTLALFATVSAFSQQSSQPPAEATPPAAPAEPARPVPVIPAKPNPFAKLPDIYQQSIDRAPASQLNPENTPADSEVLELPKMTVKQQPRPRPRLNAMETRSAILGPKAFNEELAKKMTSGFDRALNKFSLLGGQSAAERAREEYNIQRKREFLDDVLTISKAVEQTDPAAAQSLREAAGKP